MEVTFKSAVLHMKAVKGHVIGNVFCNYVQKQLKDKHQGQNIEHVTLPLCQKKTLLFTCRKSLTWEL